MRKKESLSPICCLAAVDGFGNILSACHGLRFLRPDEINERYPNKFIQLSEKRIYVYNTLFNLPEIYLLAGIIEYFIRSPDYKEIKEGFKWKDVVMSYNSIFQAVFRIRNPTIESTGFKRILKSRYKPDI